MKTVSDYEFESKYSYYWWGLGFEPCEGRRLPFKGPLSFEGEGSGHFRSYLLRVKVEGKQSAET